MWLMLSVQFTVILLLLLNICTYLESYVPLFILRLARYGRAGIQTESRPLLPDLPKRWYAHLYVFAVPLITYTHYLYFYNQELLKAVLKSLFGSPPCLDKLVLYALILLTMQIFRRTYEFIYITKSSAKINLGVYIMGYLFYFGVTASLFGGSRACTEFNPIRVAAGTLIFIWGWCKQCEANLILSSLRHSSNDQTYSIPRGGLFEYVSCANYFTELVMYSSIGIIFGFENYEFNWVLLRVLTSQIYLAGMSHQWYLKKFGSDYPKDRKRLIPFVF